MNTTEVEQLIAARGDLISGCCSSRNRFSAAARLATQLITTGGLGDSAECPLSRRQRCGESTRYAAPGLAVDEGSQRWRYPRELGMLRSGLSARYYRMAAEAADRICPDMDGAIGL